MRSIVWLRAVKLGLGSLWAWALMFTGFELVMLGGSQGIGVAGDIMLTAALIPLSAGWFVIMMLIADELCPRAWVSVTGFMKLTAGMIFWGAAALTLGRVLL